MPPMNNYSYQNYAPNYPPQQNYYSRSSPQHYNQYTPNPYSNPPAEALQNTRQSPPGFDNEYNFKFDESIKKKNSSRWFQPGRFFIKGPTIGGTTLPDINLNVLPECKIKFRKYFWPLKFTELKAGVDFDIKNTALRFRWSWKEKILGSRISLNGTEIGISKMFRLDKTGIQVEGAYDWRQQRTRVGFSVKPFQGLTATSFPQGFEFRNKIPLHRNFKVQLIGNMTFPQSGYSVSTDGISFGNGPLNINCRETNLYFNVY